MLLSITMVTYAIISALISRSWQSDPSKGDIFEMKLAQGPISSEIVSGQVISVSPVLKNIGTRNAIAFVKIEMPMYRSRSPAYTF